MDNNINVVENTKKKSKKKIVFMIISLVVAAAVIATVVFQMIHIIKLEKSNDKMKEFIEKNYDVDIEKWDGKKVALSESDLVDALSDAIDDAFGIYVNGDTFEEFMTNLLVEMEGEYMDIHEIYDDTAVVEAYKTGDSSNLSEEDLYVLETATEIINEIIKDDMTDYEKELAVYNWQVAYVNYDEEAFSAIDADVYDYNYYPYGVLKYHSAICVGNATTFKLFMDLLGIDCKIIHSTEEGEHAWNMVCLDDEWYHVDITFDSGYNGTPGYDYFNVPDSFKEYDGYPWNRDEFPEANSLKYTYVAQNATKIESIDEVPQLIKDAIDNKQTTVAIMTETPMYDTLDRIVSTISDKVDMNTWVYLETSAETEDYNLYIISIYQDSIYEEDYIGDIEDIDSEDLENVGNIIEELF